MTEKELSQLTDAELLQLAKKSKSIYTFDALIFGVLIGIAVFSTVKNGFGLFTFLPLVYIPVAARNKAKNKAVDDLLKERGLE